MVLCVTSENEIVHALIKLRAKRHPFLWRALRSQREQAVIVDQPGIFDVVVDGGAKPSRKGGVRHELLQDGDDVRVREVWYFCDTGEEEQADEVRMPLTRLVHLVVNSTEEERSLLADIRTTAPGKREARHRAYCDEVAAIVRAFVAGPPLFPVGSAAAGSATEDRAIERWRLDLVQRADCVLRRVDATTDGIGFLLSIRERLRSDRIIDQQSALLDRALSPVRVGQ